MPAAGRRAVELAFYEPSKDFRAVGRSLLPGDRLRVWGSLRDDLRSLNVEKVLVSELVPWRVRLDNPKCPVCGKSMKSLGRGKGFRCVRGHARAPPDAGRWVERPRSIQPGWYEPPAFARRHLAKPLKRLDDRLRSGPSEPSGP